MTYKTKKTSTNKPDINNKFFYLRKENEKKNENFSITNIKSIENYYKNLPDFNNIINSSFENCFAIKLAIFLIDIIDKNNFIITDDGSFSNNFYKFCLEHLSQTDLSDEINDNELIIIYIKQSINILRLSNIIAYNNETATINYNFKSKKHLFLKLFSTFWYKTNWEDIFPSNIDAAKELKRSRNILKDIILKHYNKMKLDKIANDFFELTNFSTKNDLVMISFLDFYFFTWLKHFGIIKYYNNPHLSPVYIKLTKNGQILLKSIA